MSLLQFKGRVGPTEILNGLRQARGRKGGMSGATFRFAAGSSPTPGAVALLAAWILSDRQAGGAPQISGDTAVIEALRRIDRSNLLGLPRSASAPAPRTNVVPLIAISDGAKVNEAVDSLCDLVMRHAVEPRAVMPAIEWAANEVTDNVELHASAATPGVFYARIDERRQRLELAVVDQGIGIRQSLASSTPTGSDGGVRRHDDRARGRCRDQPGQPASSVARVSPGGEGVRDAVGQHRRLMHHQNAA